MSRIQTFIHSKLETITGTISGASVLVIDIPYIIAKVVLAFVLGAVGALGAHTYKAIVSKLKRK